MTTTLYRFFDSEGLLLYVGISDSPLARFAQHSADKAWWTDVHEIKLWHFAKRDDAQEAERALISFAAPPHNVNHIGPAPAVASLKGEAARVDHFIRTHLVQDLTSRIKGRDLYAAYLESLEAPSPAPASLRRFYAVLVRHGARKSQTSGGVTFQGFALRKLQIE